MNDEHEQLKKLIQRHEGIVLRAYKCTANKTTIGIGRNLDDVGISVQEAQQLLSNDLERCRQDAQVYPWFNSLSIPRQHVIISMIFNLGAAGFKKFKKMHEQLSLENYDQAAEEMLKSLWSRQVGDRAKELAKIMQRNHYTIKQNSIGVDVLNV